MNKPPTNCHIDPQGSNCRCSRSARVSAAPLSAASPSTTAERVATDSDARWARRDFLRVLGLSAGAFVSNPWQASAGPFTRADFNKLVPEDKKLRPEWVKSLTARGTRETYSGPDLDKIGMPIGGICAGHLYLGGDGRLWHWDIFNRHIPTGPDHYAHPLEPSSPFDQGFAARIKTGKGVQERPLNAAAWSKVSFTGEYPIGYVEYADPDCPVHLRLEAFSPFIPLNTEDSALPATIFEFTVENSGAEAIDVELTAWLGNAVCLYSAETRDGVRVNRILGRKLNARTRNAGEPRAESNTPLILECSAEEPPAPPPTGRPDILFEDFEHDTYGNWTTTGTAFGAGPVKMSRMPEYQGHVGGKGLRVVNSHASAPGNSVEQKDSATGALTSPPFVISRDFISFLIGGGNHPGKTCMNLLVGNQAALSATGQNNNRMAPMTWDVRPYVGKTARLQIVDNESGPWGNIGIDQIVFTDQPHPAPGPLACEEDFGTMALALLDPRPDDSAVAQISKPADGPRGSRSPISKSAGDSNREGVTIARQQFGKKLAGLLGRKMALAPGQSQKAVFVIAWHFANLRLDRLPHGRYYATRFHSAPSVAEYIAKNFARLAGDTRLWHDTWYDSTLPYWFLDRTFANSSTLATSTCYRLGNGRFYGWEGVGCCAGTCDHVWHYAHAVARLLPELERITREKVDFGLALQPDGAIHFRAEFNDIPAVDGQAGTILRALREHQMAPDNSFLKRTWPAIKKATEWLLAKDGDGNGIIEGSQQNTLDTSWYGPVAWLSGLYLGALRAAHKMATEVGDTPFADRCQRVLEAGQENIVQDLFNGQYFYNKPDPKHLDAINSGTGCEIDQVFGQSWAFQVGLPRVFPPEQARSALKSLWRYNFTPDVGPYRKVYRPGRWYAMPGEAGLLMCTFPRADWDYAQAKGKGPEWAAGYFDECMAGFEYEVAGHMLWEGLLTEGLAITRAIHDRYHPSRRNPWNEVECGDHYARSMASYGVFLAACGFEYDGPARHIGFAPRLTPENFKCPFTSAEGWGAYSQTIDRGQFTARIGLKWGKLRVRTIALALPSASEPSSLTVAVNGQPVPAHASRHEKRLLLALAHPAEINAPEPLDIKLRLPIKG